MSGVGANTRRSSPVTPQQQAGKTPTITEALAHKSKITDRQKAIEYLEKEGYFERTGEELTVMTLSNILLILSVLNNADILKNGVRAIGILMCTKAIETTINEITNGLESSLEPLFMKLNVTTQALGDVVENFEKQIKEKDNREFGNDQPTAPRTYATMLQGEIPMTHQTNIARNLLKDCQILIDKHPEDDQFQIYSLEEEMILKKANMAVELMTDEEGPLGETDDEILDRTFISVRKLNNGGIILKTHTQKTEAAI
ncbi:hypothetical protein M422DRAFT_256708 [Sphaerobolus stellatus SS14]|uniref:Uncharacterized protein n=1 Tax=Sphaerobolus stellatus (strain SS14) TaxID=990650 RepID=A0A0C9VQH6_SPHS4|nr:hypothetical protein M422DRAFT_256708 [Sphaerobolus stellatus SS14]